MTDRKVGFKGFSQVVVYNKYCPVLDVMSWGIYAEVTVFFGKIRLGTKKKQDDDLTRCVYGIPDHWKDSIQEFCSTPLPNVDSDEWGEHEDSGLPPTLDDDDHVERTIQTSFSDTDEWGELGKD